jgi:hypothetical protein
MTRSQTPLPFLSGAAIAACVLSLLACDPPRPFNPKDGSADLTGSGVADVGPDRVASGGVNGATGGQSGTVATGGGPGSSGGDTGSVAATGGRDQPVDGGTGGQGSGGRPGGSSGGTGMGGGTGGGSSGGASATGGRGIGGAASGGAASGGAASGGRGTGGMGTGGRGTGGRATGGAASGGMGTGGAASGGMGTGGAVTCNTGMTNCSGSCVNLQTDVAHCGSCTAAPCAGTCQSGVCCAGGKTNCGGTCIDLTSDSKHCGACSGVDHDCTQGQTANERICRESRCKAVDGIACVSDGDCVSGKCNIFYADSDRDGYPSLTSAQRFCTAPSAQGTTLNYIAFRSDGKSDCCDSISAVHPGATEYVAWPSSGCAGALAGDANCDGRLEPDPTQSFVSACDNSSGTCQAVPRVITSNDCGQSYGGCNCSDSCVLGCFVSVDVRCR